MLDTDRLVDDFHAYIERAVAPLNARIKELEERLSKHAEIEDKVASAVSKYVRENPVKDGAPPSPEDVAAAVAKYFEANPVRNGDNGQNATDEQVAFAVAGYLKANPPKDAEPIAVPDVVAELVKSDALAPILDLYVEERVEEHFKSNPVKNGEDGENATDEQVAAAVAAHMKANPPQDGKSVTVEDISVFMEAALAKWALEFERRASDVLTKAIEKIPTPKDGRDGIEMPTLEYDGKRTVTLKRLSGEIAAVYKVGLPIHTGYWRDGMLCEEHDVVTHDGNAWRAVRDTKAKPCHENKEDWILFVRKGRDGRDHKDTPPPGPVKL